MRVQVISSQGARLTLQVKGVDVIGAEHTHSRTHAHTDRQKKKRQGEDRYYTHVRKQQTKRKKTNKQASKHANMHARKKTEN